MRQESLDVHKVITSIISAMNSGLRVLENCGLEPDDFYDGDRMNFVYLGQRLMKLSGVDGKKYKEMMHPRPARSDDPVLQDVLRILGVGSTPRTKR